MKKNKILAVVCIALISLFCLSACTEGGVKTVTIASTLAHADGTLLQQEKLSLTKADEGYSFTKELTKINTLDSGADSAYSTTTETGTNATFTLPTWTAEDFAELTENTETKLAGKLTADKITALGIADANGDVVATVEFDGENVVSMSISYTNTTGANISIIATITY